MNSSTSGWVILTRKPVAGSHPQNDTKDRKTHLREDNLTEIDVLSMLCLSLRPGLHHNRPCTVTIDQGQNTRLVVHLFPTERPASKPPQESRKFGSRE